MTPNSSKMSCLNCRLSDLCLPFGLQITEIEALEIIIKNKQPLQIKDVLYSKNQTCKSLYAVKTGSFRSYISNAEGLEQTIGFYLPGELMGLDALFEGRFCSSVDALETSSVCELPLTHLTELCLQIPNLQHQMTRNFSKEITANHEQMLLLGQSSAKIKVAIFLLMLSKRYGALGYSKSEFNLSMHRHHIANYLGISHETISRQLTALSKEKIIQVKRRAIKIIELNLLKAIIEPCNTDFYAHSH